MSSKKAIIPHMSDGENNCSIPPILEGWVYIIATHGPLDGPLYTWAQYTLTMRSIKTHSKIHAHSYENELFVVLQMSDQMCVSWTDMVLYGNIAEIKRLLFTI